MKINRKVLDKVIGHAMEGLAAHAVSDLKPRVIKATLDFEKVDIFLRVKGHLPQSELDGITQELLDEYCRMYEAGTLVEGTVSLKYMYDLIKSGKIKSLSLVSPASGGASAKDPRVLIDGKDVTGVKKREVVLKKDISDFKDFKGHLDIKKLKGTVCDPNKSLMWRCYSRKSGKFYSLALKRMKAIDKLCFYKGEHGQRHTGKIIAFLITDGTPVLYCKDAVAPDMTDPEITLIMP